MDCFSDDFLAAYLERTVSARERDEADAHLGTCGDCRAHVAAFARLAAARESAPVSEETLTRTRVDRPRTHERASTLPGRTIAGRYLIEGRLGGGGMGVVYRALDQQLDRRVAIKVISPRFSDNAQAEPRFLRECRLAARMSHPNAVMVLDHGRLDEGGELYLVMELLVGRTLHEHLRAGVMTEPRAVHVASQICDALDAAHRLRIIHRDLKPANIMILDDPPGRDFVKVVDFGIARSLVSDDIDLTRTNVAVGTPEFTAPEVMAGRGAVVDERADLYSLGVVLFWMLTGRPPFEATGEGGVVRATLPMDHLSPAARDLVDQLLEVEPDRRPATASDVRTRLEELEVPSGAAGMSAPTPVPDDHVALLPTLPLGVPPMAAPQPFHAPAASRRLLAVATVLLVALTLTLLIALWPAAAGSDAAAPVAPAPVQAVRSAPPPVSPPPEAAAVDVAAIPAQPIAAPVDEPDAGSAPPAQASEPATPRKKRHKAASTRAPSAPDAGPPAPKPRGRPEYIPP